MADVTKLTFETKLVASIVIGSVMMTTTVLTSHFSTKAQIDQLRSDIKLNQTVTDMRLKVVEAIVPQVNINTLTIKTIADFIEPKRIEIKSRRR